MNWVLGQDKAGYRSRQFSGAGTYWILGDIVYSTPIVVGPPSLAATPSQTRAMINGVDVPVSIPNDLAEKRGLQEVLPGLAPVRSIQHQDITILAGWCGMSARSN